MSGARTLCEQLIGVCVQLRQGGDFLWITDCQPASDSQQMVVQGLNMAGQTVKLTVERQSVQPLSARSVNRETFLTHRKACPLCGQARPTAAKLFTLNQLFWQVVVLQCCKCGLAYKEHIPNDDLLRHIYGADYTHFSTPGDVKAEIAKYRVRVNRMGKTRGRHLDYGCGAGFVVACAMQEGWDSYGVDPYLPDQPIVDSLAGRLFRMDVTDPIARRELGNFDCITLWAVFEHITSLRQTLAGLVKMLKPGGQLILNAPNAHSFIARRSGPNWRIALLLEHLQFCSLNCAHWIAHHNNLTIHGLRFAGSPFPFGTGPRDAGSQGLKGLQPEFVTLIEDKKTSVVPLPNVSRPSCINRLNALVYRTLFADGGTGLSAAIMRHGNHLLRLGDHLEIVFSRS